MRGSAAQLRDLSDSFQSFNQLTSLLESTYLELEDHVTQLQGQLAHVTEQRVQESTERARLTSQLSSILSALPAGVVVLDERGYVRECNAAAVSLLGEPLRGQLWREVILRAFAPQGDDGQDVSLKDGRLLNISTCPLGQEPGQVLLLTDVSETRDLQRRLNQHQRLLSMGEMAASLAHQIRTPLSAGLLCASQLKNPSKNPEQGQRLAGKLIDQLKHLEKLVNNMLLFSREGFHANETITAHELLSQIRQSVHTAGFTQTIEFHLSEDAADLLLLANSTVLLSAIMNVIENALDVLDENGHVRVEISADKLSQLDIRISDNGPGIAENLREKIFMPFFTTKTKGTGLGLAVVQAIAQAHQGHFWLDTEFDGGSRFVFRLPVLDKDAIYRGSK